MFYNKKCPRCGRKISKEYEFCPYCGNDFRYERRMRDEKDFGLLGKDDLIPSFPNTDFGMPMGLGKLFNSLLNEVEKQFRELDRGMTSEDNIKKIKKQGGSGISISISTSTGKKPEIKIRTFGKEGDKVREAKIIQPEITEDDARKLAKLPRKEAETNVRRLSNKIIYEIKLPGVKNIKDVVINKLENSVEIKAFSDKEVYFKLIPINLPILNYKLREGKLTLEFNPRN